MKYSGTQLVEAEVAGLGKHALGPEAAHVGVPRIRARDLQILARSGRGD